MQYLINRNEDLLSLNTALLDEIMHLELQMVWNCIIFVQKNNERSPLSYDTACKSQFSSGDSCLLACCQGINYQQNNLSSIEAALSKRLSRFS